MSKPDPVLVSGFVHHTSKVEITPITGSYNGALSREIRFYSGPDAAPFHFTLFGNNVEWIIPDDVFEAELRRRGDKAAAKIHREKAS